MGYQRTPKVYSLRYEDHPGLLVKATGATLGEFFGMAEMGDVDTSSMGVEELRQLFTPFADALVSWNLEYHRDGSNYRQGEPVPATMAGILTQDMDFILELMMGWMDALSAVSAPLASPSKNGDLSLVESLPMDVSSQSQVS